MAVDQSRFTTRLRGPLAIVDVTGDLDTRTDEPLDAAFSAALDLKARAILLEFSRAGYINSTGIALIVGLLRRAREVGTPLLASGLSEHYREIFRITRLADFISVHSDEESALAAVEKGA